MLLLRPAAESDIPQLAEWEAEPDTATWLGTTDPAWHARAIADPEQDHLIAVDGYTPVGFVVLAGLSADCRELRRMVIAQNRRRAGYGRALLHEVIAYAGSRYPARRIWLDVKAQNQRARALYAAEGFSVTDIRADAVAEPDGTTTDLVIMIRNEQS